MSTEAVLIPMVMEWDIQQAQTDLKVNCPHTFVHIEYLEKQTVMSFITVMVLYYHIIHILVWSSGLDIDLIENN